jgi:hypothetical protein
MTILLPEALDQVLQPIFANLPLDRAMQQLVVTDPQPHPETSRQIAAAVQTPGLQDRPDLVAGLWLYVDDLDKSHAACQDLDTPTGAFWHAIVHRREGDFSNAKYWLHRAAKHPAMDLIDLTGGGAGSGTAVAAYDPAATVDRVARAQQRPDDEAPALVSAQRKEWKALFNWCVQQQDALGGL